jgi:hypothetical protein
MLKTSSVILAIPQFQTPKEEEVMRFSIYKSEGAENTV